jgi:hypothetical protein
MLTVGGDSPAVDGFPFVQGKRSGCTGVIVSAWVLLAARLRDTVFFAQAGTGFKFSPHTFPGNHLGGQASWRCVFRHRFGSGLGCGYLVHWDWLRLSHLVCAD